MNKWLCVINENITQSITLPTQHISNTTQTLMDSYDYVMHGKVHHDGSNAVVIIVSHAFAAGIQVLGGCPERGRWVP